MVWPQGEAAPHPRVLVVCTANICRSPIAERMVATKLEAGGVLASVASAGFLESGRAADSTMAALVRPRGIDVSDHVSRVVSPELISAADLVVAMERRHVREMIVMAPDCQPKIHTLKGLIDSVQTGGPEGSLDERLTALDARRTMAELMGDRGADEVPDPYRKSKRRYRAAIEVLDELTTGLTAWLGASR